MHKSESIHIVSILSFVQRKQRPPPTGGRGLWDLLKKLSFL